jgi:uridine kinase
MTPFLVGIAGPSCSGKTELAFWLAHRTGAPILNLDHYYRDLNGLAFEERARANFDEPAALDHEEILRDARALAAGGAITAPRYDYSVHARIEGNQLVEPAPIIILEGLFALYWPELRDLYQLRVFVDAPSDLCLARRIRRDVQERGRTPESVREQFAATVEPMAQLHILPTRAFADVTVNGADPLDLSGPEVLARLPAAA